MNCVLKPLAFCALTSMAFDVIAHGYHPDVSVDEQTKQATIRSEAAVISQEANTRLIEADAIPDHDTGQFPNASNPNSISSQNLSYRLSLNPEPYVRLLNGDLNTFGIAVNGVPFDPGAAEYYQNDRMNGWRYEATGDGINLGLDQHNAHVQPNGTYHYHGMPHGLLENLNEQADRHSPLIGWAADGYPIYGRYSYSDPGDANSAVKAMSSSYVLKTGTRPNDGSNPGGSYDGSFVEDYEYQAKHGDLNECNARLTVTPEFPNGTYAYFITENFPVIPRCWIGIPNDSFLRQAVDTRPYLGKSSSGAWYNTGRDGEGFLVEMNKSSLVNNQLNAYWFTYDQQGNPLFIFGAGTYNDENEKITVTAYTADGTRWGEAFDSNAVTRSEWGNLSFAFDGCNSGQVEYDGQAAGFGSGQFDVSRLTAVLGTGCFEKVGDSSNAEASGTWYNTARDGEGLMVQALSGDRLNIYWFSYRPDGVPVYISGVGETDTETQQTFISEAYVTEGARFGELFDRDDVQRIPWGSLRFEYIDCQNARVSYESSDAEYGSGEHTLTRLSINEGSTCDE